MNCENIDGFINPSTRLTPTHHQQDNGKYFLTKVENSPIDIWPMKMTKAIMMMVMWQWRYWWWWWQWRWNSPVDIWLSPWMSMSTSNQTRDDSIATRFLAIAPLFGLPLFFSFSAFFRISLFQDLAPTAFFNVSSSKLVAASCFIGHRLPNVQATGQLSLDRVKVQVLIKSEFNFQQFLQCAL